MKLMLIGGGSNGHGTNPYETKEIDEEIVKMTQKENPTFLFIGLASNFSDAYYDVMKNIYKNLGCKPTYLKKSNIINNPDIVKKKIKEADIIYMSGGDTTKLIKYLIEFKLDKIILEAAERGCVISGISAGAIAIAKEGLSDYLIINNLSDKYAFTDGLKILDISICPHADKEERLIDLKEIIQKTKQEVIALDNGTALKFDGNTFTIIKSIPHAKVNLYSYQKDKLTITEIYNENVNSIIKI